MPKSILKKPPATDKVIASPPPHSREERNRETALYHANFLQQRRDVEALVLASTETLLDFPSLPDADPANPSSEDASAVKTLLKPFQPSDYDALIDERNIDRKCGYMLCPRSNKLQNTDAKLRILQSAGKGPDALRVVERQTLEKWCSDECGKRALYIRVQLNEEPAWTRAGGFSGNICLLENAPRPKQSQEAGLILVQGLEKLEISLEEDRVVAAQKELAIERGDGDAVSRASRLVEVDIHENSNSSAKEPSSPTASIEHRETHGLHGSIEGYNPKLSNSKIVRRSDLGGDDDEDAIPNV